MLSRLVNDEPCKSMTDDCVMEVELDNLVTPLELKAAFSTDVTLTQVRHFIQNGWLRHPLTVLETYFRLRDFLCSMTSVCRVAFVLSSLRHSNNRYCTWPTRVIQGSYELSSDVAIPYGGLQLIATSKLSSETVKVVPCVKHI